MRGERISGRGELTRKRTILVDEPTAGEHRGATVLGVACDRMPGGPCALGARTDQHRAGGRRPTVSMRHPAAA